ncbi:hypothetical protein [Actinocorallia longicatena]|uniref:Uncharacterized protein n=1 Tax=Actinocorallia longicatena TaxID=111803 RepID=A0ABP6Q929_9ACTN
MSDLPHGAHSVTADIKVGEGGGNGVIVAQGGRFARWSLMVQNGILTYCYTYYGRDRSYVRSAEPLRPGRHVVRLEFVYDGHETGRGATGRLIVDDARQAEGRVPATVPFRYSADGGLDIGTDSSATSAETHLSDTRFTGEINSVRIDLGPSH